MIRVLIEVVLAWIAPLQSALWSSESEESKEEEERQDQVVAELERSQIALEARWRAVRAAATAQGRRR